MCLKPCVLCFTRPQVELLSTVAPGSDLNKVAATLADAAVKVGSTDDVTLVVMRLGTA